MYGRRLNPQEGQDKTSTTMKKGAGIGISQDKFRPTSLFGKLSVNA